MRRTLPILLLLLLTPISATAKGKLPLAKGSPGVLELNVKLAELANDPRLGGGGARLGVVARWLETGTDVVRMRHDEAFNVASVVKLLTSAAALRLLGPEFQFKTVAYSARRAKDGEVRGDLCLKGFGDPALDEGALWQMAQQLHERGISAVAGGLVIDESYFDSNRDPPLFETRDSEMYWRATTGALALDRNTLYVMVRGGAKKGDPAKVLVQPRSPHFVPVSRVTTTSRGGRDRLRVTTALLQEPAGAVEVTVSGKVRPRKLQQVARLRVADPGMAAARAFLQALARRGITLGKPGVTRGECPKKPEVLAWWKSQPLSRLLHVMNKKSDNFMAEQLLKTVGAEMSGKPGSSAAGLKAVGRYLAGAGLKPGTYTMKNGSGLYEASSLTPDQVVSVLRHALRDFKTGPDLAASLAIAGVDGTLRRRQRGAASERYVRGKTGTLTGVVSLAGLAGGSSRRPLVFAAVINGLPEGKASKGRAVLDEVAAALVSFLER